MVSQRAKIDSGVTLIELTIATAIASIVVFLGYDVFSKLQLYNQKFAALAEFNEISHFILNNTDCGASLPPSGCIAGNVVALQGRKNDGTFKTIVSANASAPTIQGQYQLRAVCNSSGTGVFVQALRPRPGKTFNSTNIADYLTDHRVEKSLANTSVESHLFPVKADLCQSNTASLVTSNVSFVSENCISTAFFPGRFAYCPGNTVMRGSDPSITGLGTPETRAYCCEIVRYRN